MDSSQQQSQVKTLLRSRFWFLSAFSVLLVVVFAYYLPLRFQYQAGDHMNEEDIPHDHVESGGDMRLGHDLPDVAALERLPLKSPENAALSLPYVVNNGVKEFHLEAGEFRWEYEPGKWVHAWGYNGQIPGPEIRVYEGDDVRIIVKNNLPDATSVHWHGLDVPWQEDGVPGVTQEAIPSGSEFVYEFKAVPAGTRFYHSHGKSHTTSAQQMDMGLSGAFIVVPKIEDIHADRDYTLVLDEWDILNGVNTAVSHMHGAGESGAVPEYNTFTINGRVFPHIDPLKVGENEDVLIRFINAGTSAFHPMHLHGHSFEVVAKDGFIIPESARERHNTITIHPGETVDILAHTDNPGAWLLHCHHVHHAAAGMISLFEYDGYEPMQHVETVVESADEMQNNMYTTDSTSNYREESQITNGFVVTLSHIPDMVMTGVNTLLRFMLESRPSNTFVSEDALSLNHERIMHAIGVRDDLNEFFHIHPLPTGEPGVLGVGYTFKNPGTYKVWSEVVQDGREYTFGHPLITVQGAGSASKGKNVTFSRNIVVDTYQVELLADEPIVKNQETTFSFDIHKNGLEAELENYLGVPMHLAIIKDDLTQFIHAHPAGASRAHAFRDDGIMNRIARVPTVFAHGDEDDSHEEENAPIMMAGDHGVSFAVTFPDAGLYKMFAQFRPKDADLEPDETITVSFWVEVNSESPLPISPWWILLIISVVCMAVLSKVVQRFLRVPHV